MLNSYRFTVGKDDFLVLTELALEVLQRSSWGHFSGFWGAAVPGEFGSVSVRVQNVRDVFAGKKYADMYVFAP